MVGLDQQSVPKQLNNEVPSHVVLVNMVNNKVLQGTCNEKQTIDLSLSERVQLKFRDGK